LQEYYASGRSDIRAFDFTRGGEKYKKDIGCENKPVSGLAFSLRCYKSEESSLH
jgi:hypothetical protein